jgi:nicotinamide mononucleotide adenylyltransferase
MIKNKNFLILEMARDELKSKNENYRIIGGYLSPVSDGYKKEGLAQSEDRIEMCKLACLSSEWIECDEWEARIPEHTRTALVLQHIEKGLKDQVCQKIKVILLAGADMILSIERPGLWCSEDVKRKDVL